MWRGRPRPRSVDRSKPEVAVPFQNFPHRDWSLVTDNEPSLAPSCWLAIEQCRDTRLSDVPSTNTGVGCRTIKPLPALSSSPFDRLAHSFYPHRPVTWLCDTACTTMANALIYRQPFVMPNHIHLLFWALRDPTGWPFPLVDIMQSLKGSSAYTLNQLLRRGGPVWDEESFDHVLRSDESWEQKREYIRQNPVRAGLARSPEEYRWLWLNPLA